MRNSFILYRTHDSDLIGLLDMVGVQEFGQILKESIRILTRDSYAPKHVPPTYITPYEGEKEQFVLSVCIESKKDADIAELLTHVKPRRFGNFCKMAMRFYIGRVSTLQAMLDISLIPRIVIGMSDDVLRNNTFCVVTNIPAPEAQKSPRVRKNPEESNPKENNPNYTEEKQICETVTPVASPEPESILSNIAAPVAPVSTSIPTKTEDGQEFTWNSGLVLDTDEEDDDILSMLEGMM